MSRYRRSTTAGATLFFTVNTFHRQPLLTQPDVREALRKGIAELRRELPFTVAAWGLMPDHLHCIWELPPSDAAFGPKTFPTCCPAGPDQSS